MYNWKNSGTIYVSPSIGYDDDMGGFCPSCEYVGIYTDMEYIIPEEFESLAEYLLSVTD